MLQDISMKASGIVLLFIALFTAPLLGEVDSLFRELIRVNSRVKTIDAEIEQYIRDASGSIEIFKGRYRADQSGRFRIDYHTPHNQIVVNNGSELLWYYPDDKLLYVIGTGTEEAALSVHPLTELSRMVSRDFHVTYLGEHLFGFFTLAHQFIITNKKKNLTIDVWIEVKRKVVLARTVRNPLGQEILKEMYGGYRDIGGILFPMRIDVYAKSKAGVTRNTTYYRKVFLNRSMPGRIFHLTLPDDVLMRRYGE